MNHMPPCLVEADVDTFGYLYNGTAAEIPVVNDIREAQKSSRLEVHWERGASGRLPNIFRHNLLRDFVCDETALQVLRNISGIDLQTVALLRLDGQPLTAVRAAPRLDVVDEPHSIPSEYTWARIGFPHIREELWEEVSKRIFHLVYPELSTVVVAGAEVCEEYRRSGLSGWSFEPAVVARE